MSCKACKISVNSNAFQSFMYITFIFAYLLYTCLVDLSIGVSGVLKSPTIIVLLLISPFIMYFKERLYCPTLF